MLGRLTVLRVSQLDFAEARDLARRGLAAGTRGRGRAGRTRAAWTRSRPPPPTSAWSTNWRPSWRSWSRCCAALGDLWTLQWAVFESSFVPLAAGDDAARARPDRRRPGDLPAQRLHRLRAVLRRAPGLGAPARRPTGRGPAGGTPGGRTRPAHRHTWWSTTAVVALRRHPARLRRARRAPPTSSARPRSWPTSPAPRPTCCAAWDRSRRPPATPTCCGGPTTCCAASGHRRAAPGCSAPTPTSGWRAPGGGPATPTRADGILTGFAAAARAAGWAVLEVAGA